MYSAAALNDILMPFFGVPLTVITMAAFGAFASFAYGEPVRPRRKLYLLALANTFLASSAVAVFPEMMGWEWASPKVAPALAALLAGVSRFAIPAIVDAIPRIINKVFRLDKEEKKDEAA